MSSRDSSRAGPFQSPSRTHSLLSYSSGMRRESYQTLDGAVVDSPYPQARANSVLNHSISEKYSLSPDIRSWGADLSPDLVESDDVLHNPNQRDHSSGSWNYRGLTNVGCLLILALSILALFVGYPALSFVRQKIADSSQGLNLGGAFNASGQIPQIGNFGLVDLDTPKEAWTKTSLRDGSKMVLVFSDEFNTDGRTFYPGDDPYWEAHDYHYWSTNNLEWYDPAGLSTKNGALHITLEEKQTHNLSYQGGLMTTWNKFCFTGGYIEAAVRLPGTNTVAGLWPAVWTLGNLGRAGYGASLEGMWPYSYDACDVGTAPNQTWQGVPSSPEVVGDHAYPGAPLSYLQGQRLSRCTCTGEDHPGPIHPDGTYVGRSAPEIDVIEAQVGGTTPKGEVSQSAQFAPFNNAYKWDHTPQNMKIANASISKINGFVGNIVQQAGSVVTDTNQRCYQLLDDCFSQYAFEASTYKPGFDDAYVTWTSDNKVSWTLEQAGFGADPISEISSRPIPQEPMYIIVNLGMSKNFGDIDFDQLTFPAIMEIDYIRVYQRSDSINIGCDPEDFPTKAYIEKHIEAYTDYNLTDWRGTVGQGGYGQSFPKSSYLGQC
ncbi:hypothetical protein D9611_002501 [Ephemerocybe angulata]|uniref:GH16 domain-containing protein n=1 Tax=Ephemerocybe angulata TaxID=980116 RepID=A0A8H5C1T6_9AGAR|nr:hypothetical protein D9611_002501 [Tulosesus angulatus]